MSELFPNQYWGMDIWKHQELPIIESHDFNFFRCIEFTNNYYGKTVSELHQGNLRVSRKDNRYSMLFPGQKLSYWADSPQTARAEVKKWGARNNLLTFWAYDDGSSLIPTVYPADYLRIIDGIHFRFDEILKKLNNGLSLSREEQSLIDKIASMEPDCLAYKSEARKGGVCFLFFEHGFKKLSLREVSLRLGNNKGKNYTTVPCVITSDFTPVLESYGYYFEPIAKTKFDKAYYDSNEYILRKQVKDHSLKRVREAMK